MRNRLTIAYLVLAALYLALFEYNASWLGAWVKILPILLLAAGSAWLGRGRWRSAMIGALLLFGGALVFAFSDALIALNRFVEPIYRAGFLIVPSYYLAQLLLWRGAHSRSPAHAA